MRADHRLGVPRPRRVAVLRALQLGDLLCAVPALRALRAALPDAEIVLIGQPWARDFVARFNRYLDGFIEFPGFPGLPERPPDVAGVPRFLDEVQGRRFDLVIQMHGSGAITNPLAVLFGGRLTAGYFLPGNYCPDPERFMPFAADTPEIRLHLRLMEFLGIDGGDDALEFPIHAVDEQGAYAALSGTAARSAPYVCIHPGAQLPSRRWLPERFAAAGDLVAARGLQVVLTGTDGERPLTRSVAAAMRAPAIDLAGRTSLGALGALIRDARLLIANDTGVSHIAAAVGTPSVIVVTASDPARWAPLDRIRHQVVWQPVACRPCAYQVCPIGHPCATTLTVAPVLERVASALDRSDDRARVDADAMSDGAVSAAS